MRVRDPKIGHRNQKLMPARGVPAYTQSTQLRTLIFECPKNKIVLNREKCDSNMPHPGKVFTLQVYRFCNNPETKQ